VKAVCEALGVARSNVMTMRSRPSGWTDRRRGARDAAADLEVIDEIKTVIEAQPSYGYIRVWGMVRNRRHAEGQGAINRKRIHRIMRENNLLLPQRHRAKNNTRAHDGRVAVDRSDTRWCSDGFEIKCWNNEKVRVAFVQDCCDREAISWVATTKGIDGVLVQDMLVVAVEQRFGSLLAAPRQIEFLTDNGSCYTDKRVRKHAGKMNLKPVRTPIESPQSNGMAESFVKTFKRDYVAFGDLTDAKTALEQLPKWFEHYNSLHPHSALKYLSPKMFRKHQLTNTDCPGKQG
jgi:putative transposase